MTRTTRRTVLLGMGGVALAIGGVSTQMGKPRDVFRATLTGLIGPFAMEDTEFNRFVEDFADAFGDIGTLHGDALRLVSVVPAIAHMTPALASRVEHFQRQLLTEFALATGLTGRPGPDKLEYAGLFKANACNNPYARLS